MVKINQGDSKKTFVKTFRSNKVENDVIQTGGATRRWFVYRGYIV